METIRCRSLALHLIPIGRDILPILAWLESSTAISILAWLESFAPYMDHRS